MFIDLNMGRRRPEDSWTQSWWSSETESLLLPLLMRSAASEPKGWVWWIWAWWRAIPNRAPAAYLCVGDNIDDIAVTRGGDSGR